MDVFTMALEAAVCRLNASWRARRLGLRMKDGLATVWLCIACYADDIVIIARSAVAAQAMLADLEVAIETIGLTLAAAKLEWIGANILESWQVMHKGSVARRIHDNKCVGSVITGTRTDAFDVQKRIQAGWRAFHAIKHLMCRRQVSLCRRISLWVMAIRVLSSPMRWRPSR